MAQALAAAVQQAHLLKALGQTTWDEKARLGPSYNYCRLGTAAPQLKFTPASVSRAVCSGLQELPDLVASSARFCQLGSASPGSTTAVERVANCSATPAIAEQLATCSTPDVDPNDAVSNWQNRADLLAGCEPDAAPLKVAVLLSGGVDSSLALRLLQAAGHNVTAFYLQIWFQEDFRNFWDTCPWEEDLHYCRQVCEQAGVHLEVVPMTQQYWDRVVAHCVAEIRAGRTPNPDVLCNSRVKFGAFFEFLESWVGDSFDRIASGHYARLIRPQPGPEPTPQSSTRHPSRQPSGDSPAFEPAARPAAHPAAPGSATAATPAAQLTARDGSMPTAAAGNRSAPPASRADAGSSRGALPVGGAPHDACSADIGDIDILERLAGSRQPRAPPSPGAVRLALTADAVKDQTYFLAHLTQRQLARTLFPLGPLTKTQVRQLATAADLPNKARRDSQGICFLGKVKFDEFVREHLGEWPGPIMDEAAGQILGYHRGVWFHTLGQRKGFNHHGGPWYVSRKDVDTNTIYVAKRADYYAAGRRRDAFTCSSFNWSSPGGPDPGLPLQCKVRHSPNMYACQLSFHGSRESAAAESGTAGREPTGAADGGDADKRKPMREGVARSDGSWAQLDAAGIASGAELGSESAHEPARESATVVLDSNDQGLAAGQYVAFYQDGVCLGSAVIDGMLVRPEQGGAADS